MNNFHFISIYFIDSCWTRRKHAIRIDFGHRRRLVNNNYFVKRNLKYKKPSFFIGNFGQFLFRRATVPETIQEIYSWYPNEKMFGMFDWRKPVVVVRDPELLKQLTMKHHDHFEDHRSVIELVPEDLLGSTLFTMNGQRWRDMRATLSPAFTGSKMRQMFELVVVCADEMTSHFLKKAAGGEKNSLEIQNIFSRFTNDVIASCAFGIQVNSFENPNNEFSAMREKFQNGFSIMQTLRFFVILALPQLAKVFNVQVTSCEVSQFFRSLVINTMDERQKRGIIRHDMINLLMQVRQGKPTDQPEIAQQDEKDGFAVAGESKFGRKSEQTQWTDNELVAQCLIFFTAGFLPTSTMLTFLSYELCIHPHIQQKLYDEIAGTNKNLDGKGISYDALQKMKYLDQVVSEGLRKWPLGLTDRLCVKEYECAYGDDAKFRFEKGVPIWIPIYGLHHDPKYYPDPEKFDPERFSDENKRNIVPGTYLPFGIGPRKCIGKYK